MCGLVGMMSSNMNLKHKDVLTDLLYLDTWRGRDSTGVAVIRQNGLTDVMKSTVPGFEFIDGPKLGQFLRSTDYVWIGHNRFGTVGKNTKANAHPFMVEDDAGDCIMVGAHNGTLKNKYSLKNHDLYGTDSEALFNNIAAEGLEATLAKTEGAWALTYYDHWIDKMCFVRNGGRPLWYAFSENKNTVFWASEAWMLNIACSRRDIAITKPEQFEVDTLYTIDAPVKVNEELSFEKKGGVVGKQPVGFFRGNVPGWTGGQAGPTAQRQTNPQAQQKAGPGASSSGTLSVKDGQKQGTTTSPSSNGQSGNNNVVPIDHAKTYRGFGGTQISRADLEEQLSDGCHWCEVHSIAPEDKFGWLAPGVPVCANCLDGEHEEKAEILSWFDSGLGDNKVTVN